MKKIIALLAFLAFLMLAGVAHAQAVYYISYASGSNSNNGLSQGAAWKSAPYMNHSAGCDSSSGPSYTHHAGDKFIFKGGDTWPYTCFGMTIPAGGTSTAQDYYGTCGGQATAPSACSGATWPSSGWTRPLFDMAGHVVSTAGGYQVIYGVYPAAAPYVTIDDIEIAHQGIGGLSSPPNSNYRNQCAISFAAASGAYTIGTVVENVYIHGMVAGISTGPSQPYAGLGYCAGGVNAVALMDHSEINGDDSTNGGITPTTSNWLQFAGGCLECGVVQYSKIHGTINGCDMQPEGGTYSCHDNEIYNVGNAGETGDPSTGIHSHVIYDGQTASNNPSLLVYNNAIHDTMTGLVIYVFPKSSVYNNVMWNNHHNAAIYVDCYAPVNCSGSTSYVFNNTVDTTGGDTSVLHTNTSWSGTAFVRNNIYLGSQGLGTLGTTTTYSNNHLVTPTEASTYGFVIGNKYSPSSSDPSVSGQGLNLTSSCSGTLSQLCLDTSGAPWFGGSYKTRPTGSTGWDLGAYQGQGGTGGPPAVSITMPTPGTISGIVSLTATCTPQGSATVGSIQFQINSVPFGSAGTSSPYSISLDTTKIANNSNTISAVCTDSNSQTNTSSVVNVTVSNSTPGCVTSDSRAIFSQAFTTETTTFTATWTETPNSAANDTVFGLSPAAAISYSSMSALLLADVSGVWKAWNNAVPGYMAVNSAPYVSGTSYSFSGTFTFSAGALVSYSISETSPSSIVIASAYTPRASASSLSYFNLISDQALYDTIKACNFTIGAGTSLSFSPSSFNFGPVTIGSTPSTSIGVTSSGGATTFSSVVSSDPTHFPITNTCTGSQTSCATSVTFQPAAAQVYTAIITYTDSATGSPQTVPVQGTGVTVAPTMTPSPTSLNFGYVALNSTPAAQGPITVTLTNPPATGVSVAISGGTNPGDFGVSGNACSGTVSTTTCLIVLTASPTVPTLETANLVISSTNASNSPVTVPLQVTGVVFNPPAPSPKSFVWNGTMDEAVTVKGKSATLTVPVACACTLSSGLALTCTCQ